MFEMLATNISIYYFLKWRRMLAILIFRSVSNYSFQKCWQLQFPDILAIIIFRAVSSYDLEMMATNGSNILFYRNGDESEQLWFLKILAIIFSRNAGDAC